VELPSTSDALDIYIKEINSYSVLSADEEFALAVSLKKHNSIKAAEKLVVSNLRFVVKIAHEYRNYNVRLIDLIQEGNIGLIHAVKKFDPYKGYRLISYAVWWIRAYMQNFIIKSWSIVKIGTTQAQRRLFFKLSQTKKQLQSLSEKKPEFKEIAESIGVNEKEAIEMDQRFTNRDYSLDTQASDEDSPLINYLAYEGENQESALIKKEELALVQRHIAGAIDKLSSRESFIIKNRVMADNPMTLQEVGDHFHITRERVRQLEKQALKKLQLALPLKEKEVPLLTA